MSAAASPAGPPSGRPAGFAGTLYDRLVLGLLPPGAEAMKPALTAAVDMERPGC